MQTRLLGLGIGALTLMVAIAAIPPEKASSADIPPCVAAAAWVEENLDVLPTTYAELSTYSPLYRKAIYSRLSNDTRATLWHEHLRHFMASTELTGAQVAFVRAADSRVEWYLADERPDADLDAVVREARAVLGDAWTKQAFFLMGPADASVPVVSEACSCHESIEENFAADAVFAECPGGYACAEDGDGCDDIQDECGFFDTQVCNGECLSPT